MIALELGSVPSVPFLSTSLDTLNKPKHLAVKHSSTRGTQTGNLPNKNTRKWEYKKLFKTLPSGRIADQRISFMSSFKIPISCSQRTIRNIVK